MYILNNGNNGRLGYNERSQLELSYSNTIVLDEVYLDEDQLAETGIDDPATFEKSNYMYTVSMNLHKHIVYTRKRYLSVVISTGDGAPIRYKIDLRDTKNFIRQFRRNTPRLAVKSRPGAIGPQNNSDLQGSASPHTYLRDLRPINPDRAYLAGVRYINSQQESRFLAKEFGLRTPNILSYMLDDVPMPRKLKNQDKNEYLVTPNTGKLAATKFYSNNTSLDVSVDRRMALYGSFVNFPNRRGFIDCYQTEVPVRKIDFTKTFQIPGNKLAETGMLTFTFSFLDSEERLVGGILTEQIDHSVAHRDFFSRLQSTPEMSITKTGRKGRTCVINVKSNKAKNSTVRLYRYAFSPNEFKIFQFKEIISPQVASTKGGNIYKFTDNEFAVHPVCFIYKAINVENDEFVGSTASIIRRGEEFDTVKINDDYGNDAKIYVVESKINTTVYFENLSSQISQVKVMRKNLTRNSFTYVSEFTADSPMYSFIDREPKIRGDIYEYSYVYTTSYRPTKFRKSKSYCTVVCNKAYKPTPELVFEPTLTTEISEDGRSAVVGLNFNVVGQRPNMSTSFLRSLGIESDLAPIMLQSSYLALFSVNRIDLSTGTSQFIGFFTGTETVVETIDIVSNQGNNTVYAVEQHVVHMSFLANDYMPYRHPDYHMTGYAPSELDFEHNGTLESTFNRAKLGLVKSVSYRGPTSIVTPRLESLVARRIYQNRHCVEWQVNNSSTIDYFVVVGIINGREYILGTVEASNSHRNYYFVDEQLSDRIGIIEYKIIAAKTDLTLTHFSDRVTLDNMFSTSDEVMQSRVSGGGMNFVINA